MKRELEHFTIGDSYGGNQDWFRTFMMRMGGCGAETACDSSLYFALHMGLKGIYPFDPKNLSQDEYVDFAHMMEKYLWPRLSGINKPEIYVEGYSKYLQDRGVDCIRMSILDGSEPYETAADTIKKQIDSGYPVPMLNLNHKDKAFQDYDWHWFLINGYDEADNTLLVKAVTYSSFQWLDFKRLWDTGYNNKGGLVIYKNNGFNSGSGIRSMDKKTLCLYYSRTNTTRVIMKRIAMLLDADLFEYTDGKDRSGFKGYIASCIDSLKEPPEVHIIGDEPQWDAYDRVIVAMPTWAESPCIVGKAFLQQYSGKFRGDLYLVVTHMAKTDYDKAIRKAYDYSTVTPKAYLSLQTKNHDPEKEIQSFVRSIVEQ